MLNLQVLQWSFTLRVDDPISVSIETSPEGPEINAASALSLRCLASGGTGAYSYQWNSTCAGDCLLSGVNANMNTLSRDAVRSADSGLYTCTVTDNAGNNGTNSTQIQVTGMNNNKDKYSSL